MDINIPQQINTAIEAAYQAGKEILRVYHTEDFEVQTKWDNSPLTLADKQAHKIILNILKSTHIPVLSEEGKSIPFEERAKWRYYWLVDPLDGTKEFIRRNGEFTVNIALIENGIPVGGVVYAPCLNDLYFAAKNMGAFKTSVFNINFDELNLDRLINISQKLPVFDNKEKFTVVASRSHLNEETEKFIEGLKTQYDDIEFISKGSSLKIVMVAEGRADLYPRFAPTMEWDTAAGHAIALYAGCEIMQEDGQTPLVYNKNELLNPWFIVQRKG
ncbi:MAG: 3'(2'),5'-bisphosphate nucleotidase CysQ [Bacteroidales bacterium]|jgi:3'(2'), 5'-bisphosphate nucleotidase|nr:3'(2'),5'-bisphosphate nucleotidase CysQ [Bacteroidales bacterium]